MEAIGILVVLALLLILTMLGFRNRSKLGTWLRDPAAESSIDPQARRKWLIRRIEDYQDELFRIDDEEKGGGDIKK